MAGEFSASIARFGQRSQEQIRLVSQKIAMEAFKRIIMKSPVDTGRFRANWGVMIGSPYTGTSAASDKMGTATVAHASINVTAWNGQGSIFLCNNLPYSLALEYGSSKQAPGGMVRITAAEMQGVADQVARAMK